MQPQPTSSDGSRASRKHLHIFEGNTHWLFQDVQMAAAECIQIEERDQELVKNMSLFDCWERVHCTVCYISATLGKCVYMLLVLLTRRYISM